MFFPWLNKAMVPADPNAIVISKDRTAEIATALAQPAPTELRILTWNIDGLDEVGGGHVGWWKPGEIWGNYGKFKKRAWLEAKM